MLSLQAYRVLTHMSECQFSFVWAWWKWQGLLCFDTGAFQPCDIYADVRYSPLCLHLEPLTKGKRTVADSEDNLGPRWIFVVLELFPGHFQIVRILLALGALDQANHKNQATTWQVRKHIQTCSRDSKQARVEVTKGHARRARFNVF